MFAISKKFFNKLGGFDPGMDMWGAENLEMSFKVSYACTILYFYLIQSVFFLCVYSVALLALLC